MIPLPAFIDAEAWQGFVDMRKSKGKRVPFTEYAAKLILVELYRLKDAGHDPNACLDQSTMHGWSDVYPLKDKAIPKQAATVPNKALEALHAHDKALADPDARARSEEARKATIAKFPQLRRAS